MGFTYLLRVEEDLDRLDVPAPSDTAVAEAWSEQGGVGEPPAAMVPHIAAALRRAWLEAHRGERLAEVDAARRWASDNLGWRPLLEDTTITAILAERGEPSLHRAFYSEASDAWFDAAPALERVRAVRAHARSDTLDPAVREELAALERALAELRERGLRFRFDFCD